MVDRQSKAQALAYFDDNQIPQRMQDALNVLWKLDPPDPHGFVSTYFEELGQPPTVTRIMATGSLDSKGQPAVCSRVYCSSRNKEICAGRSDVAYDTILTEASGREEKDAEDSKREKEVEDAINLVNNEIRDILESTNPRHLKSLDEQVYEFVETKLRESEEDKPPTEEIPAPGSATVQDDKKGGKKSGKGASAKKKGAQVVIVPDKPVETPYPGWLAVTSVSLAVAVAGSTITKQKLYDHLLTCFDDESYNIRLPLPVITILQGGKAATGKANCVKEYMITPRPDMPAAEAIATASKVQETIVKTLLAKSGASIKYFSDLGAVLPVLDKVEQGLDMITEAVTQAGCEMGKDFFFMLHAASREFFDYEKGKYEVLAGSLKAPEDMADFWNDLCNRYNSIIGIIDPLRCEEKEQWNKICATISHRCLVIADRAYSRPGLLKSETLDFHQFATSGAVWRLEGPNTLSDLVACSRKLADMDNVILLSSGQHDTLDTSIVDIAIACKARFIKLGAVSRGERVVKYNRLIDIENELGERRKEWEPLVFPNIPPKQPTPSPDEEDAKVEG